MTLLRRRPVSSWKRLCWRRFYEKKVLKVSVRVLWNPIFNATVKFIDKTDRDGWGSRYTSTNQLLETYLKKSESIVSL